MADASISFDTSLDTKQLETELRRVRSKILKLQEDVYSRDNGKLPLVKRVEELKDILDHAQKRLEKINASDLPTDRKNKAIGQQIREIEEVKAELEQANAALSEYQAKTDEITEKINTQRGIEEEISNEIRRRAEEEDKAGESAGRTSDQVRQIHKNANKAADGVRDIGKGAKYSGDAISKLTKRIVGLARRVFIFSVITKALRAIKEWFSDVIKQDSEATAAMAQLKGALLTLIQPLVNVIIPAFTIFVQWLTRAVTVLVSLVSSLFGTTVQQSAAAAKALNDQTKAYKQMGKAAADAKSLMGFDEINQLSDNSNSSSGIAADFSAINDSSMDAITAVLEEWVTGIGPAVLFAVGALLTFSGMNIPLGLAMMAGGAYLFATETAPNWDALGEDIQNTINGILTVTGLTTLVIGAILAFSNVNIPLGIALMATGALALGTAATLNWNAILEFLEGSNGAVVAVISGTLIVIGFILAFSNANIALGIGLIAVGAIGLAAPIAANWDYLVDMLQSKVGLIVGIVSTALLALGIILCVTGVGVPLGIGLIVAGAVGLATVVAVNWNFLIETLQGKVGVIIGIVSAALLVLGIILCITGVGIPLGIALIAAGAAGLVTVVAVNWNAITDKLKSVWESIKAFWAEHIAPVFTSDWWKEKMGVIGKAIGNGFITIANSVLGIVNTLWVGILSGINFIIGAFNKIQIAIPDWVPGLGGTTFGINIPLIDTSKLAIKQIPYLAQGAVIPPNKQFMAVLGDQKNGTNLEAPESLIRQIVREESTSPEFLVAMMAGFEAVVAAINEKNMNVNISERTIGAAAERYRLRSARANGV